MQRKKARVPSQYAPKRQFVAVRAIQVRLLNSWPKYRRGYSEYFACLPYTSRNKQGKQNCTAGLLPTEHYGGNGAVIALVIKLNGKCKLKFMQAYEPLSSYEDEAVTVRTTMSNRIGSEWGKRSVPDGDAKI